MYAVRFVTTYPNPRSFKAKQHSCARVRRSAYVVIVVCPARFKFKAWDMLGPRKGGDVRGQHPSYCQHHHHRILRHAPSTVLATISCVQF